MAEASLTAGQKPAVLIYFSGWGYNKHMATTTVTIPKKVTKGEELVIITRREYKDFLDFKKLSEFEPTVAQRRALAQARKNRRSGKFLTFDELKEKLGFTN
jgi:hypothetical protein